MIITTTDPITGNELVNPESRPYIIEGEGYLAVKIYFESEETRRAYLDIDVRHPELDLTAKLANPDLDAGDFNQTGPRLR